VQKRLFSHQGSATAVLGITGRSRTRRFVFPLSGLRYSAARRTVSYRATRLTKRGGTAKTATVVPRHFGAASLSVVPGSPLGGSKLGASPPGASLGATGVYGGHDCEMSVWNDTDNDMVQGNPIQLVSSQQWDTDTWYEPPRTDIIDYEQSSDFVSAGGFLRGCSQSTVWHFIPECFVGEGCGPSGTFTLTVEWDWSWVAPRSTCTSSNPDFKCVNGTVGTIANYSLVPSSETG
jgi:hypothetical protein